MSWLTKRAVPILDEHVLRDDEGQVITEVDEARLQEIAKKNNQRVAQTGDLTPIVIGHTKDDTAEEQQPEIVGYACNFRVAPFRKTGRKALVADFKFMASKKALVNKYPRRSVELWLSDWKIDPIALLGATTPERDLGLLQLSRDGRKKIRRVMYSANDGMGAGQGGPPMGNEGQDQGQGNPLVQELLAALEQTDVFQWVRQQMEQAESMANMPPPGMPGMDAGLPPEAMMPEDEGDLFGDEDDFGDEEDYEDEEDSEEDDEDEEEDEDEDEDEPVRMQASTASGTNTYCPPSTGYRRQMSRPTARPGQPPRRPQAQQYQQAPRARRRAQPQDAGLAPSLAERVRLAADARRVQYARQEQINQALAEENAHLRLKFQKSERERDLIQLEAEGIDLDRVAELDFVQGMPEDYYRRYLANIRRQYRRAPIGRLAFSAEDMRAAGPTRGRTKERSLEIAQYAAEKGLSYQAALEQFEGDQ
jgi:hypothetical protein